MPDRPGHEGRAMPLEPLPETRRALDSVGRWSDSDLLATLLTQGASVQQVVPSCVGLSLTFVDGGLTFTLVASSSQTALLDGVQYATGGPCEDAVGEDRVIHGGGDGGLLDEDRWTSFARAGAAAGVRSTLSLPIHEEGRVVGGVNLYASEPRAFVGKVEEVAAVLGAWAPAAVANADLSFATRVSARLAPGLLDAENTVGQAMGVVMAVRGVDRATARRVIADAAVRSGHEEVAIARAILIPHESGS